MATLQSVKSLDSKMNSSNTATRQILEELGDKVQNLSGWSAEQSDTSRAILDLLKQLVSEKSPVSDAETLGTAATSSDRNACDVEELTETLDEDNTGIQQCLDRLCRLAEETDRTLYSEDAESIVDDLRNLLDVSLKAGNPSTEGKKDKRKRESHDSTDNDKTLHNQRAVKRMKDILSASQCVSLNGRGTYPLVLSLY